MAKTNILIIFILFPIILFAQFYPYKVNEKLKKYKSIYITDKDKYYNSKEILNNGIIIKKIDYVKKKKVYTTDYFYYPNGEIKYRIEKAKHYDYVDSSFYEHKFNEENKKTEIKYINDDFIVTYLYSDFNNIGLPQTMTYVSDYKYKENWYLKICYKYDSIGNILQEKKIYASKTEIEDYKYDQFSNLIEIQRSSIPKVEYPIILVGGIIYENEKFRYIYNEDNLWIEKYRTIGGVETLYQKRKFKLK